MVNRLQLARRALRRQYRAERNKYIRWLSDCAEMANNGGSNMICIFRKTDNGIKVSSPKGMIYANPALFNEDYSSVNEAKFFLN